MVEAGVVLLHTGNVGSEVEQSDQVEGRGWSEPAAYGWARVEGRLFPRQEGNRVGSLFPAFPSRMLSVAVSRKINMRGSPLLRSAC
eukprot:768001-Hanusia_phi.AAC.3